MHSGFQTKKLAGVATADLPHAHPAMPLGIRNRFRQFGHSKTLRCSQVCHAVNWFEADCVFLHVLTRDFPLSKSVPIGKKRLPLLDLFWYDVVSPNMPTCICIFETGLVTQKMILACRNQVIPISQVH